MKNILRAAVAALFAFGTAEAASVPSVPVQALCGIAGGVACLDQTGKVPAANLPAGGGGNGISTGQIGAANGVAGLDANANVAAGNLGNLLAVKIISASTYTLSAADYHQALRFTSTSPTAVTVPASSSLPANFVVTVDVAATAGAVTFSTSGGTLINETTAVVMSAAEGGQIYVNATGGNFSIRNLPFAAGSGLASAVSNGRRTLSVASVSGAALDSGLGLSATGPVQRIGSGTYATMTAAQQTAYLNTFSSSLAGSVPASGGGTTNFLRADGTWAAPPSGGGSGTITGVTAGAGLSGGGSSGNVPLALQAMPVYMTASGTISAAAAAQDVHVCSAGAVTVTLPTIAANYGTTVTADKLGQAGAACSGAVTVASPDGHIYGVNTSGGNVVLSLGQSVALGWDSNANYTANFLTQAGSGGSVTLTSPNSTLNISGSGTNILTVDIAVPAVPIAGGTMTAPLVLPGTSSIAAPALQFGSATGSGIVTNSGINGLQVARNGTQNIQIGPQVLVGPYSTAIRTEASTASPNGFPALFQVVNSGSATFAPFIGYAVGAFPGSVTVGHSNSNTIGTNVALPANSPEGFIYFDAADGTNFTTGASIGCYDEVATATPGVAPSRCELSTANSAGVVTKVIRFDSKQHEITVTAGNLVTGANWTNIGTTPSVASWSGDGAGSLTLSSGFGSATYTLTFAGGAWPNPPICGMNDMTQAAGIPQSASSTTATTFKVPSTLTPASGDVLTWSCRAASAS